MHTDPGATRYALQIQLHNDGFIVHGLEDDLAAMPLFAPGLAIVLDTWSPHQVARDLRLPQTGPNKLLVGADYAGYPNVDAELPKLIEHIPMLAYQNPRGPPDGGDRQSTGDGRDAQDQALSPQPAQE